MPVPFLEAVAKRRLRGSIEVTPIIVRCRWTTRPTIMEFGNLDMEPPEDGAHFVEYFRQFVGEMENIMMQTKLRNKTRSKLVHISPEFRHQIHYYIMEIRNIIDRIDLHCRAWIERCPFIVISSANAAGAMDTSPKGDPPGFVKVLDEHTLAIPDRSPPAQRKDVA